MNDNERSLKESSVKIPPSSDGFDQAVTKQGAGLTNPGPYLLKDEKLSKLLKSWQSIDPSPAFESNIWRRIRQLPVERQEPFSFRHFLREWTNMRPAFVTAAAVLVGIVAGLTSALTITVPSRSLHNNLFRPLPEKSLSASYIQLVGGEKL